MADLQRQLTQIRDIRFDGDTSKEGLDASAPVSDHTAGRLKRRYLADLAPTRGLPINTDLSTFDKSRKIEHVPKKPKHGMRDEPLQKYHEYMSFEQAGPATIAYDDAHNLYAISY